jgi:hypothetical protein
MGGLISMHTGGTLAPHVRRRFDHEHGQVRVSSFGEPIRWNMAVRAAHVAALPIRVCSPVPSRYGEDSKIGHRLLHNCHCSGTPRGTFGSCLPEMEVFMSSLPIATPRFDRQWPLYGVRRLLAGLSAARCRLMHRTISRPVNGHYRCWVCLREFRTDW